MTGTHLFQASHLVDSMQDVNYQSALVDISVEDATITSQAVSKYAGDTYTNTNSINDNSFY